uniref:Uncharacterized protein n=1 Tax=Cajanus cajan TaxID=3821 RepID=A0A151QWJ2_CAJCA|nr:hypothetical protein KK1_044330 [Cajanus cajan]
MNFRELSPSIEVPSNVLPPIDSSPAIMSQKKKPHKKRSQRKLQHLDVLIDVNLPTQAQAHSSPAMNLRELSPSIEVPSNVSPPIDSSPANYVSEEETPQEKIPKEAPTSRRTNRVSSQHWNVDVIDLEGVIKKIKIKVREVNNLPSGERIVVEFDDQGQANGQAQGLLVGFCGILATDCNLFPINFKRWLGCKEKYTLLESQLHGTLNALKAYMIMKEGKIPDELASFFLSQPSDVGSEPKSPLDARGSFGGSNLNSQSNI